MLRPQGVGSGEAIAVPGDYGTAFAGDFWNKIGISRTFCHGQADFKFRFLIFGNFCSFFVLNRSTGMLLRYR
jgi:hypothetical protein